MGGARMRRIPRREVAQGFVSALTDGRLGVIEGGPGSGRSSLLADVRSLWPHECLAWPADGDVPALRASLRATLRPHLLFVDDADALPVTQRAALADLADELPARHRLVVVTRGHCALLRDLAARLAGARAAGAELLFSMAEIEQRVTGVVPEPPESARLLHAGTAGWAEGIQAVLAAGWPRRRGVIVADVAPAMVAARVRALPPLERWGAACAFAVPRMRQSLVHAFLPDVDVVRALLDARVPLLREDADAWRLPYPLGRLFPAEPLDPLDASRLALEAAEGLVPEMFQLLWAAGHDIVAMDLLDEATAAEAEELLAGWHAPARVPGRLARRMPVAAERLLRAADRAGHPDRQPFVRQMEAQAAGEGPLDERLRAQAARELLHRGRTARAEQAAAAVLREAHGDVARAIALEVLGRAARRSGRAERLAEADRLLKESLALWRREGEPTRVGELRLCLAWVDRDRARLSRAVQRARAVRTSADAYGPLWAQAALVEADLLCEAGCCGDARDLLHELELRCFDWAGPRIQARAAVLRAASALHRGREEEAAYWANKVSGLPLAWMDGVCGVRNLAATAEIWSCLGQPQRASMSLSLLATQVGDPDVGTVLARAAVNARCGDAAAALAVLRGLAADEAVPARERWRVLLLAAQAALRARAGDAGALADAALRAAGAAGQPFAPFVREGPTVRKLLRSSAAVWEGAG